ncbi:MAG: YkvA family protein [Clostridia bacterium]|nr:YkvA family protein [Clostridia bacterium]
MSTFKEAAKTLKARARQLKLETAALFLACKRPDIPWYAKLFILIVVGYALSPIDLIPDFVPVLGYLDDLLLIPLGISLAIKLIPPEIMEACRLQAKDLFKNGKPKNYIAAFVIILLWILVLGSILYRIIF